MVNFCVKTPQVLTNYLNKFRTCFSKPVFVSFCFYVSGLFLELKRTNIQSISDRTLQFNYEKIQYFISEAKWATEELNDQRLAILQSNRTTKTCKKGVLVIDDSGCKKWGLKTEGAQIQHYGTEDIITRCNIVVTSAYCDNKKRYPINFRPYKPEQEFFFKKDDPDFKSKIQLARELIEDALNKKLNFSDVLFDSWYFSNDFVDFLQQNRLTFISEAESNRLISFRGKWTHADELVKLIPSHKFKVVTVFNSHGEKKSFWTYGFKTKLKNINGNFFVVISIGYWNNSDPKKVHVYVTNHISLSADEVIKKHSLRWGIEWVFRDLKENVAFDHYQVRSIKSISRHWHLASLAYTFLLISRLNGSFSKSFQLKTKSISKQLVLFRKLNSFSAINWIVLNPITYQNYLGIKNSFPLTH